MTETRTEPWLAGQYVGDACQEAVEIANAAHAPYLTLFNGTPLDAYPGELASEVHTRWVLERELYQITKRAKKPAPDYASNDHIQAYQDRIALLDIIKELRQAAGND